MENLDSMTEDQLLEFYNKVELLKQYAASKIVAIRQRKLGNIKVARQYEKECDKIFQKLPSWARW